MVPNPPSPTYLPPNEEDSIDDVIGSISPDSASTTEQAEATNSTVYNNIGQITEDMIQVPIRELKFTDYQDFLDIPPVPMIETLIDGINQGTQTIPLRPICVVVGYTIAMRMPEQLTSNLSGQDPDLEALMNMLC